MLAQIAGRVQLALSVKAAFETLDRHLFVPGRRVDDAYGPDPVPVVDAGDTSGCTTTPPLVQGHLLNLADVRLGQRVLLAGGAPGVTASMLEHLAGPGGDVVVLESSGMLVGRTRLMLAATGHERIRVEHLDATGQLPFADGEFDRVISTGSVPGIPAEWCRVLRHGGRMVLPLRIGGHCRITALLREEHRLAAERWVAHDVVPLRWKALPGDGADQLVPLDGGRLLHVAPADAARTLLAADCVTGPGTVTWSKVVLAPGLSLDDLALVLAADGAIVGRLTAPDGPLPVATGCPALVDTGGIAAVVLGPAPAGEPAGAWQLGVEAHGPGSAELAADLIAQARSWVMRANRPITLHAYPQGTPEARMDAGTTVTDLPGARVVIGL